MEEISNTTGQRIGYIRVSTAGQNIARQQEALKEAGEIRRTFIDRTSGKNRNRPQLNELLLYMREGDHVVVPAIDRMARSIVDLQSLIDEITAKGASVEFLKENMMINAHGSSAMEQMQLQILGVFAEFERNISKERQAEGIAEAKKRGVYSRPRTKKISSAQAREIAARAATGELKTALAREFEVDRSTIYKALRAAKSAEATTTTQGEGA